MAKSVATNNPAIALRRGELSNLTWDEAYYALINDLTADQAMRVLRVMSNTTKLYEMLGAFVENSLAPEPALTVRCKTCGAEQAKLICDVCRATFARQAGRPPESIDDAEGGHEDDVVGAAGGGNQ